MLDLLVPLLQVVVAARQQGPGMLANRLHLLLAHVGGQDELPGVLVALTTQAQAQLHFSQLARNLPRQLVEHLHVFGGIPKLLAQSFNAGMHRGQGLVVRFQIGGVASEQVTTLPRLGIHHALQQGIDGLACLQAVRHLRHGLLRSHLAGLVDAHQHNGCQHGHGQADGHFADFGQPAVYAFSKIHARSSG